MESKASSEVQSVVATGIRSEPAPAPAADSGITSFLVEVPSDTWDRLAFIAAVATPRLVMLAVLGLFTAVLLDYAFIVGTWVKADDPTGTILFAVLVYVPILVILWIMVYVFVSSGLTSLHLTILMRYLGTIETELDRRLADLGGVGMICDFIGSTGSCNFMMPLQNALYNEISFTHTRRFFTPAESLSLVPVVLAMPKFSGTEIGALNVIVDVWRRGFPVVRVYCGRKVSVRTTLMADGYYSATRELIFKARQAAGRVPFGDGHVVLGSPFCRV